MRVRRAGQGIGTALATVALLAAAPGEAAEPRFEGRVVDAKTGDPVPYVNVGVPALAAGTVSAADGRFALVLSGIAPEAALPEGATAVFSALGFRTRSVPMVAWPADGIVPLDPVELGFQERVEVRAEATGTPQILGKDYPLPGYSFGFGSGLLGAEIGARIRVRNPTYVESANFVVAHTGGERFLYRVNIYDFADGEIGENLLRENVLVTARQERGTLTVDLRDRGLILRGDVLLSLEWIRDDDGAGNGNVMFRAHPRGRGRLYRRLTSQMPFQPVPRHDVGFYLVGWSLDERAVVR